jgi:hypothetical protein
LKSDAEQQAQLEAEKFISQAAETAVVDTAIIQRGRDVQTKRKITKKPKKSTSRSQKRSTTKKVARKAKRAAVPRKPSLALPDAVRGVKRANLTATGAAKRALTDDLEITCLFDENPRKGWQASQLEIARSSRTVGEYVSRGGGRPELLYNWDRNYLLIGGRKSSKPISRGRVRD